MGLPKRPDCVVRVPAAIFVGERATLHIEIDCEKPVKIELIDVRLCGHQGWVIGGGKSSVGTRIIFPNLEKRVMGEGALTAGQHQFSVAFTLPPGTAPTHDIAPAHSRMTIEVHASIPWWPDGRYTFEVPVRLAPPAHAERTPIVVREPFEAASDQPRMELALASSTLICGEAVIGSIAVFHMDDRKDREVDIAFEPDLRLHADGHTYQRWGDGYRTRITLPAGSAGTAVPFRIGLPANMAPSFVTVTHEATWYMTATIGSVFRTKLRARLPLVILDTRAAEQLPPLTLVPRVADERVLAIFASFAKHQNMALVANERDEYPSEQPAVEQDLASAKLRVGYDYRGKAGTFLVGRLTYPNLGLGLHVTPSSPIRELLSEDVEVDFGEFDRSHRVVARDAGQAAPFLRKLLPLPTLGTLIRFTDDTIVYEQGVAQVEPPAIGHMVTSLRLFADKLAAATAAIDPPTGLGIDIPAWEALAGRYEARLCRADLSFTGKMDSVPVDVSLVFDSNDKPTATRAWVGDPERATERVREVTLKLAHPAFDAANVTPERLSSLLATWSSDIVDLEVSKGVASAALRVASGGIDPYRVRDMVRTLRELLASLDEDTGPYR